MEPKKIAIVGVIVVLVVAGLVIGSSFLVFPTNQLTRTTQDTDLLELGLEVPNNWEFGLSNGSTLSLSDLQGHVVLVDLMATWCSTCSTENGFLQTVADDLAGTVVVVSLTVDSDETTSMMAAYKLDHGLTWAHGVDNRQFMDYFSISSIPSMVLIDANGVFRYFHVGLWSVANISATIASIM